MRKTALSLRTASIALLAAAALAGPAAAQLRIEGRQGIPAEPRAVTPRDALSPDEERTIGIFERSSPSVVYLTTVRHVRDFFTRNVMRVPRGTGSGFIWDEHGHVVTNYHVIQGAAEAVVTLADQRRYPATLVGYSRDHDLAVLRVDVPADLPPPVPIGTSEDLRVGQNVLAIGNPFGLDHTLTTGVISALNRSIDNGRGGSIENLIQTDAAINPGNSGGPLIDSAGRLVGINTAIVSPSGGYAGIGFAVPVDTVNRVIPRLIRFGRYVRPTLGVSIDDDISAALLGGLGIEGVLVLRVASGSPAALAGLRPTQTTLGGSVILGDVIQGIAGRTVVNVEDLNRALENLTVGEQVRLRVWRNGEQVLVPVTLAAVPQ
jgi:S1-C subfamily serine protease